MIIQILFLLLLISMNAFFAATEIAFISINSMKVELKVKEGNKKAILISKMLKDPSKFLATIQIGITLAGFLSSAFASETFSEKLAVKFYDLIPKISLSTWENISIVVVTLILSYFTLVFGELVPKRIAMKYSEKLAYLSVKIIKIISIITLPFVKFLTISTEILSKIFGVEDEEESVTEEEIRMMVNAGGDNGSIKIEEKEMINNVFEFNDKLVSEIMTPRIDIFALDMEMTANKVIKELTNEGNRYSRIPVYEDTIDNIRGVIYIKDILLGVKNRDEKLKNIMNEAYYVPETNYINDTFEALRKNKKQIAIVIDEYGGTAGLVTIEDILEELVGEIYDEYDNDDLKFEIIDENTFLINGDLSIYDVEKILDITIPDGDYDTISGYILDNINKIPYDKENVIFETEELTYKIENLKNNRIIKIKVCRNNNYNNQDKMK